MATFSSSALLSSVMGHTRGQGIQILESGCGALLPRPIEASCIEGGTPVARCITFAESPDKRLSSGLWECTAGQFKVSFAVDEIPATPHTSRWVWLPTGMFRDLCENSSSCACPAVARPWREFANDSQSNRGLAHPPPSSIPHFAR
jgi:hypothetical protein